MIAYLKGKILWKQQDSAIVKVDGLGYELFLPKTLLEEVKVGEEREFFTYEYFREESRELYGFLNLEELTLFSELLRVSGVGPRIALNVLSLGETKVKEAITKGNVAFLSSVSGVGKKTAQKIILELKGVLTEDKITKIDEEAVEALRQLGYTHREALEALRKIEGVETTEEKIKAALKILGRH
jgi:Holliday junction DNA helicase RuvA